MSIRYYEDFKVGDRFTSAGLTMTEAAIIDFAQQWDPQPFHTDAEFAKKWTFGGLIASGLHTMAVTLRLWLDQGVFRVAAAWARPASARSSSRGRYGRATRCAW